MALAAAATVPVVEVEEEAAVVVVVVVGAEEEAVVGVVADVKSCYLDNGFIGFRHDNHACVRSFLRPKVAYATDF